MDGPTLIIEKLRFYKLKHLNDGCRFPIVVVVVVEVVVVVVVVVVIVLVSIGFKILCGFLYRSSY